MESFNNEPRLTQTANYEFSSTEERLIGDLAGKMKFVSYFFIIVGALQVFSGLVRIFRVSTVDGINIIINGLINLFIGIWTYKAASSFGLVAKTRGHDIDNLMDALKQLKSLYVFLYWLLIIALVIFAIFAIVALFS